MIPLHFVHLQNVPILDQLQWEEALLRNDHRNWCIINHGSPPAIVMGISGKMETLVNQNELLAKPIPVIRRFSGGGTVVVDRNTFFVTFIFNKEALTIPSFPEPIMRWTECFYRPLFHPHPFALRENDYVIGEKKFGGNAQSITKSRWLHHSSFLFHFSSVLMNYLRIPDKMPKYRMNRSHTEFLCQLSEFRPCLETLKKDLIRQLTDRFALVEMETGELEMIAKLPHRKTTAVI